MTISSQWLKAWARCSLIYFCSIFCFGRIGLIAHELIGHALPAKLLGLKLESIELSWFGGGSVHWQGHQELPPWQMLWLYGGGLWIELILAMILWGFRQHSSMVLRWICLGLAIVLINHAFYYWATSTHGVFADGRVIAEYLPLSRSAQSAILSCFAVLSAYCSAPSLWIWSHRFHSHTNLLQHLCIHATAVALAMAIYFSAHLMEQQFSVPYSHEHKRVFKAEYQYKVEQAIEKHIQQHGNKPSEDWVQKLINKEQPNPNFPIYLAVAMLTGFGVHLILTIRKDPKPQTHQEDSPSFFDRS